MAGNQAVFQWDGVDCIAQTTKYVKGINVPCTVEIDTDHTI